MIDELDFGALGEAAFEQIETAYPLCRSITGEGVRATLDLVADHIPLTVHEVPSGTPVFDWQVPKEWNVRDAFVKDGNGRRVIDFRKSNLHLLSYSIPVSTRMSLAELDPHLYSLPDQPDLIPYRTSYYQERWGFCLRHRDREALEDQSYEVVIDSTLEDGSLTYGELFVPGRSERTVLLSTHVCHPSLANDNLSGIFVATALAKILSTRDLRYSYRFVFVPGTIGAMTWLARNQGEVVDSIAHGLVLANLGDGGLFHFKRSRHGAREVDRVVEQVLKDSGREFGLEDFEPFGYDERQYCSPGFDLPVGLLSRSPWGRFPEYHTSADDLEFVRPEHLARSIERLVETVEVLESNRCFQNLNPMCEPQLGRRSLYETIGGGESGRQRQLALLWVLNQSDGQHSLLDIARRSGITYRQIRAAADSLLNAELLAPA